MALIFPLLVVLVMAIVDYGGFLQAKQNMITITRSGARYAGLNPDITSLSTLNPAPSTTVQGVMQAEAGTNYALPNSDIVVDYYDNSSSSPGTLCGEFTAAGSYAGKNGYPSTGTTCLQQPGQSPRVVEVTVVFASKSTFPLLSSLGIPLTVTEHYWMPEVPS